MAANDTQVGGEHYKKLGIQPWDYIAENNLGWFEGAVVKYVTRWRSKDGVADLYKAKHILDKLIEIEEAREIPTLTESVLARAMMPEG